MSDPFEPFDANRVLLRCVTLGDAEQTAALMTPGISRWLSHWSMPFTRERATERIESVRAMAFRGDALPFAVVGKTDQTLMGWVMLHRDRDEWRRASFGYWLGERYQGQGYMREIAPVAIAAGFASLEVEVIEAGAQVDHVASFAVMRACGMRPSREGWMHAPARDRDEFCRFFAVRRGDTCGATARP